MISTRKGDDELAYLIFFIKKEKNLTTIQQSDFSRDIN